MAQSLVATALRLPTTEQSFAGGDLAGLSRSRCDTCARVPVVRWNADVMQTGRFAVAARRRVRYGSFLQSDFVAFDAVLFRISPAEAKPLEPQ